MKGSQARQLGLKQLAVGGGAALFVRRPTSSRGRLLAGAALPCQSFGAHLKQHGMAAGACNALWAPCTPCRAARRSACSWPLRSPSGRWCAAAACSADALQCGLRPVVFEPHSCGSGLCLPHCTPVAHQASYFSMCPHCCMAQVGAAAGRTHICARHRVHQQVRLCALNHPLLPLL